MDIDEFLGNYVARPLMDADEFLKRYASGERHFMGVNLSKVYFQGIDLRRIRLTHADMSQAFLSGADLRGARLGKVYLNSADLNGADLRGINLINSQLHLTNLNGADLSGAKLMKINLNGANLRGAKLCGAYIDTVEFNETNLEGTDFNGVEFGNDWNRYFNGGEVSDDVAPFYNPLANQTVNNQGIAFYLNSRIYTWETFRFRSKSEIKIAQALDRAKVLFMPNCLTRLNHSDNSDRRINLEPDFLVCNQGKFGILEVDGPWHSPQRRVEEQQRERQFLYHGIRLVQRFDSLRCEKEPDSVVKEFLKMVEMMYQVS